jgi:hypothetical protein
MNLLAGAAAGREASVIAVMALTSDLRSIRARGRSSGRKGTGLCTVIRSPPPRRMTHSRRVWHYVIFGRRKLAPELAPDGKGRAGLSGDESPGKAQKPLKIGHSGPRRGGREPLQRFGKPLPPAGNITRHLHGIIFKAGKSLKLLALPRGVHEFSNFNVLAKSGAAFSSMGSLCFFPRVSHRLRAEFGKGTHSRPSSSLP